MSSAASLRSNYPSWAKTSLSLAAEPQPKGSDGKHEMDSELNQEDFRRLQEWWLQARESQSFVRCEMDIDENFYHGDQFTTEDRLALEAVGQAALVFNKVKPVIDWMIGTERRTKVDFKVLPRQKGKEVDAKVKTDVLKYISDVSKAPFARSEAFKETVVSGLGWLEAGVRRDSEDDPIYIRQESWRNIWYDPLGTQKDTSDWRYLFRSKWTDLDIGLAMFPDREIELRSASTSVNIDLATSDDDEYYIGQRFSRRDSSGRQTGLPSYTDAVSGQINNRRERIRLVECWYRTPKKAQKVKGGKHHGRVVNLKNQRMMYELNADIAKGVCSVYDAVVMQVRCAVFCEDTLLQNMDSPYHHNRFPFIPIFAYRKGKFHEPYGGVRNIRDPQEDLNKRYSKALFILSNTRVIADRNAVKDWEGFREEAARPDGLLLIDTPKARLEMDKDKGLAEEQVKLMHNDGIHIMESAGVTPENLGRDTNAISGKAVLAKQTQGSVVSAELYDNLRFSQQLLGEVTLSLAEQFYDQPKAIRISGERGAIHWHEINAANDSGEILNDITATQMDYIVAEQDFRDTMRQAMFESLSDMVSKMDPQVSIQLLDAIVDLTDFPGKAELIARIRKINGQMPPASEMTPEQQAEAAALKKKAEDAMALKMKGIELEFGEKQAKIDKLKADAERIRAEIPTLGLDGKAQLDMERKLFEAEKKTAAAETKLREDLAKAQQALANRHMELENDRTVKLEVANIDATTQERTAKIAADAEVEVAQIEAKASVEAAQATDQMAALATQVEHHKGETQRVAKEAADRSAAEAATRKETDTKVATERKATEDKAKQKMAEDEKKFNETRAADEKKAKDAQAVQDKKDKAAKEEQAAKDKKAGEKGAVPIVVNVTVGGATTSTKSKIVKGADGVFHVETVKDSGDAKGKK